jgi:N-acetylglucosaminyldiphosphoundecaprenol N-acetyl-beta-D-mannosaminyltransferase
MRVERTTYELAGEEIMRRAEEGRGGYVCVANVDMAVRAFYDAGFLRIINEAALVTPDGMPLVWTLRAKGLRDTVRVYGPALTLAVCQKAEARKVPVGFYGGSSEEALGAMIKNIKGRFPALNIAYAFSPPFRLLTKEEDGRVTKDITTSGAKILFVGLGCPKQEMWMAGHKDMVPALMLGVGAAFDFIAGVKKQAPRWMQQSGLEWLFRLMQEPRRLWRRYLIGNSLFILLVLKEASADLIRKMMRR